MRNWPPYLHLDVPLLIYELVAEGQLLEIVYTLPNYPFRVKSFLLPKDTRVLNYTAKDPS